MQKSELLEKAKALPPGKLIGDALFALGVGYREGRPILREAGYKFTDGRGRSCWKVSKQKWADVDWLRRNDADIGKQLGVSRERAGQIREAMGKPQSVNFHRPVKTTKMTDRFRKMKAELSGQSLDQIRRQVRMRLSDWQLKKYLDRAGIKYRKNGKA